MAALPRASSPLQQLAQAFEAGRYAEVISLAEALAGQAPGSPEPLRYLAAALVESGDLERAAATYAQALKRAPTDLQLLLGASEQLICIPGEDREAIAEGLRLCEQGRRLAQKTGREALHFEFLLLEGIACNQLGEGAQALGCLEQALRLSPRSAEALIERAVALFELCRFEQSRECLLRALQQSASEPSAHYYLGLLAERGGQRREAQRCFERARSLSPEEFPRPVELSEEAFDAAVLEAVALLPSQVTGTLDHTTLAVEQVPSDEDLLAESPPLSPLILGVFRSGGEPLQTAIVLYQRNLERFARTREELVEQIAITLMHEVGHLMGLGEEDLWERGLE